MWDVILDIVTSHFVWGILLGLVIAAIGAYLQARFQHDRLVQQQRRDVAVLCHDIISNIMRIADDIAEARRRSRVIHNDLLALLDAEVGIFGRCREHTIRLDDGVRTDVRKYITDCALRRYDVGVKLGEFDKQMQLHLDPTAAGDQLAAQNAGNQANSILQEAHKAMDELIAKAGQGTALIQRLQT